VNPCPVCGARSSVTTQHAPVDFEYGVRPSAAMHYDRCLECGSEFLSPRPEPGAILTFYPPDYHAWRSGRGLVVRFLARLRARRRGRRYRHLLAGRRGRLFDVGPGSGRHLAEMQRFCDLECAGVEINPEMAARARANGHAVVTGTLEALEPGPGDGTFDLVSMNHVLEHMSEPRKGLRRAFELLRPGGYVLGQLPAVDSWDRGLFGRAWGGYHFPRHLQAFSRRALGCALRSAGFEDVRIEDAAHLQAAVSVQNWLVERGFHLRLTAGKWRLHAVLMAAVAPFELAALAAGRAGVISFEARKPRDAGEGPPHA
jgi:SAM-dependent methyltransferase